MNDYKVKDSGKREQFKSGMQRDTAQDKILWHLVADGPMLGRLAAHLTKGALKYSPGNWLKAEGQEELDRFRQSAFRHFMQWWAGETDEDHAAAVFFNVNGAEYVASKRFRAYFEFDMGDPRMPLSAPESGDLTN